MTLKAKHFSLTLLLAPSKLKIKRVTIQRKNGQTTINTTKKARRRKQRRIKTPSWASANARVPLTTSKISSTVKRSKKSQ